MNNDWMKSELTTAVMIYQAALERTGSSDLQASLKAAAALSQMSLDEITRATAQLLNRSESFVIEMRKDLMK